MDVKKQQFVEMKSYYQKIKTWKDQENQVIHKEIVNQTKTVTDWLMEDIFHIRKATLSSYGLDFNPQVNKVFQNQLYYKLEYKLLLLLQIILYRQNIPPWSPIKDKYGRSIQSEQEKRQQRKKIDQNREDDEQRFYQLFTPEQKLISDLKNLLQDVTQLQGQTIDGRAKSELLKIFLVDYNEIVKYKSDQLNRIKEIEEELGVLDQNYEKIQSKSLYERLYETKIGHVKNQLTDELNDQQCLQQMNSRRGQLQRERQSILVNSAQVFQLNRNEISNSPQNSPKTSQKTSPQLSSKRSPKILPRHSPRHSPKQSPILSPYLQIKKDQLESTSNSKIIRLNSQNRIIKQVNPFDKSQNEEYDINNLIQTTSISKNDLYIPLSRANSNNSIKFSQQTSTPQKSLLKQKNQFTYKSNIQGSPSSRGFNVSISTPRSQSNAPASGDQSNQSINVKRQVNKSLTQRSLFSQYNKESASGETSPKDEEENRIDSRLTNRQMMNASPAQDVFHYREKQDQPERKSPEKFQRHFTQTKTQYVVGSSQENETKQIKLFHHSKTTDLDYSKQNGNNSIVIKQLQQCDSRSKSPIVSTYNSKNNLQNYLNVSIKQENENVQTKIERSKSRQCSSGYKKETSNTNRAHTPLKQTSSNQNNSSFTKCGKGQCQSTRKVQSSLSNIQEKDWKQIFQNAKHQSNKIKLSSTYKK